MGGKCNHYARGPAEEGAAPRQPAPALAEAEAAKEGSKRSAAAVVCKHRNALIASAGLQFAFGCTLPKGATGQQGEALGGWLQLALARRASKERGWRMVWLMFDSKAVVALVKAVHGTQAPALGGWTLWTVTVFDG